MYIVKMELLSYEHLILKKKNKKGSVIQNGSKRDEKKLFLFVWDIDNCDVFGRIATYKSWAWI